MGRLPLQLPRATSTCWRVCSAARCWRCSPMRTTPAS
jgi:hypothetical protein